jgi:hypothetical protein
MPMTSEVNNLAAGCAALAICESLLLALTEAKILDSHDVRGVLQDAATVHRDAESAMMEAAVHREAAQMIECIISSHSALSRR